MPIKLTSFSEDPLCAGHEWSVDDVDLLALQIARVAVGQSRHVKKILDGGVSVFALPPQSIVANAQRLLTAPDSDPYHRDGWMFQVMSWIAAQKATPHSIITAPHMILAHKGFDGLQIEIDQASQKVSAAIIFEDKATENPRSTITSKVWPELKRLEKGEMEIVLAAETVSLLERYPQLDPDHAIKNILWNQVRRFRVSITADSTHAGSAGRMSLFKGYDTVATGPISRRSGQVFEIPDLRAWMKILAEKAIAALPGIP